MLDTKHIYDTMVRLVATPSVSGTDSEKDAAYVIRDILTELKYFQKHPESVRLVPLENDLLGRYLVTAFLPAKEKTADTAILTGHYDIVDVEEYGALRDIACDVEKISKRMGELPLDPDSARDFESGEWIFGRGTADMKYGHALIIELLRYFSEEGADSLRGNLLYVAVCGEETNSEGMLRASRFFNEFANEQGLVYRALLLTECSIADAPDAAEYRYIHYGASGKVMPMFLVSGESSHSDEPFTGIDPLLVNAEIYERMMLDPEFCQSARGEVTPPPVCLKSKDLKTTYSASSPMYAVSYYTVVTVDLDPADLLKRTERIAREAFEAALERRRARLSEFCEKTGAVPAVRDYAPSVVTYAELYREVKAAYDGDFDGYMREHIKPMIEAKAELQDIAVEIVRHTLELRRDRKPTVVVSIIPPYYPDAYPDPEAPDAKKLLSCVEDVISLAKEKYGEKLRMRDYYMGISDMSYIGLDTKRDFRALFDSLVGAGMIYDFPFEELTAFHVPAIVLGGYGKDFHKHTERLEKHYDFDVLPHLYVRLIEKLFA